MKYVINNPDYSLSPYTGMTKQHWLDVCKFFLNGIFSNVDESNLRINIPREETEISYPNERTAKWKEDSARFEGLARSFLIAAPLLRNEPDVSISGYSMREYYKNQILEAVTPGAFNYMLGLKEVQALANEGETTFQHTVECASLVIGLDFCKEVIWDLYTKEEKDRIAAYFMEFALSRTVAHNWRLFNMLLLGFLYKEGYKIDEGVMRDHAQTILSYYAGDGWYRDGHRFDYYTPWAFQVYGSIWASWYGYEKEPYIAGKIEEYSNEMLKTYAGMFDKEAHMSMWGRSGIYRSATTAPFAANFLLDKALADPGLARRICSGTLLQFITKEEMFLNGVPRLGFYGLFPPLLQEYNCAESPFWIGNSFVCLCLPDEHPFWTKTENNGDWEGLEKSQNITAVLDGPGIVLDRHGANGASEFRTAKVLYPKGHIFIKSYLRLSFHSHFPWENFDYNGVEAMQYSLLYNKNKEAQVPNILMYGGEQDGVLYRKEYFDFDFDFQGGASIDLADFSVSNGMVRVDKMRIPDKPYILSLGAYGFPDEGGVTVEKREKNGAKAIILKGHKRQLAMVIYAGFEEIDVKERIGVNPISDKSILVYGTCTRENYYEYRPYVLISAILSKNDLEDWSEEELFPIKKIRFEDETGYGGYGKIWLDLEDGRSRTVDYESVEGKLSI